MLPGASPGRQWSLTLNAGLIIATVAGMAATGLIMLTLPLLSHDFLVVRSDAGYAAALLLGVPLTTIAVLQDQVFVAERKTGYMLIRNVFSSLLKVPLLLVPVVLQQQALGIMGAWVLATAASVIFGFIQVRQLGRSYRPALRGIGAVMKSMRSSLFGHHLINVGNVAPMYLLPVWVAARLSVTDNAYYYITWRLGSLFFMVSPAVATSLFAEGSHEASTIMRKARSSALIIGILLVPAMVVFFVGGSRILAVFGPSFPKHGLLLLYLLILSAVPDAITNIAVSVLRVRQRLSSAAFLNIGMAVLALVLAWLWLPMLGIAGAGWAWLAAQSAGTLAILILAGSARRRWGWSATQSSRGPRPAAPALVVPAPGQLVGTHSASGAGDAGAGTSD
jgi:O-antigen/teichoic acid export membrane protein